MTTCVVGLATNDRQYPAALRRLRLSLTEAGFAGHVLLWQPGTFPSGSPSHEDVPFAFKPFCLLDAGRHGMRHVLWMDAACVAVRRLEPIFDLIAAQGYALFRNRRYRVGEWSSDGTLQVMGIDRAHALRIPEINCAVMGLDLSADIGSTFLELWRTAAVERDAFRGGAPIAGPDDLDALKWNRAGRASPDPRVRGHRFDQTVAGIIAHRLGMRLSAASLLGIYSRAHPRIGRRARVVVDRDARSDVELSTVERVLADRQRSVSARTLRRPAAARPRGNRRT